jgi:hypothetical protein
MKRKRIAVLAFLVIGLDVLTATIVLWFRPMLARAQSNINLVILLELEPALIDACSTLVGSEVSQVTFDEAMQALAKVEEAYPGSTDIATPLMWETWEKVESRNGKIAFAKTGLAELIEAGITVMKQHALNIGDESLYNLALEWETESAPCLLAAEQLVVAIDVKPGSYPNCFNINGNGVIPVAVLGTADFDVSRIDPSTLAFGGLDIRVKGNGAPQCSVEDVSGDLSSPEGAPDGHPDLVCQFVDDATAWTPDNGIATLTGKLKADFDATPIVGSGEICVVP